MRQNPFGGIVAVTRHDGVVTKRTGRGDVIGSVKTHRPAALDEGDIAGRWGGVAPVGGKTTYVSQAPYAAYILYAG